MRVPGVASCRVWRSIALRLILVSRHDESAAQVLDCLAFPFEQFFWGVSESPRLLDGGDDGIFFGAVIRVDDNLVRLGHAALQLAR